MKQIKVNSNCSGCGLCLINSDYLEENEDGNAQPVKGKTIRETDLERMKEIVKNCPEKALQIEDDNLDIIEYINKQINDLKAFKGVKLPSKFSIPFDYQEYDIPVPKATGERRYCYSSDNAAESAAKREFNEKMYSNINNIFLQVIVSYRVKYLKKYYTKDGDSEYFKANKLVKSKLETIIDLMNSHLDCNIEKEFCDVELYPENDILWKMLNNGELISDDLVSTVRRSFDDDACTRLSDYESCWDTTYEDEYVGKGAFGNDKYKSSWCYFDVDKAFETLKKDIRCALMYSQSNIEDYSLERICDLIKVYNKQLNSIIQKKADYLFKQLSKTNKTENKSSTSKSYPKEPQTIIAYEVRDKENEEYFITHVDNSNYIFVNGDIVWEMNVCGIKHREVILKDEQFNYAVIVGYKGYIFFDVSNDDDKRLMMYDIKTKSVSVIDKLVFGFVYYNDKLYYNSWQWDDRFCTKLIYEYDINLKKKRYLTDIGGGFKLIRNFRIEDNKLQFVVWDVSAEERTNKAIDLQ